MVILSPPSFLIFLQDGCTALYLASENGHVEVVKLLLQKHADVNVCKEVRTVTIGQHTVCLLCSSVVCGHQALMVAGYKQSVILAELMTDVWVLHVCVH